jgi:hypothetical protein
MNEYASSALLIRLAPDSGFNFIGAKDICGPGTLPNLNGCPSSYHLSRQAYPPHDERVAVLFQYVRRAARLAQAASVGGLFHDNLDEGPRGAGSSPPVR